MRPTDTTAAGTPAAMRIVGAAQALAVSTCRRLNVVDRKSIGTPRRLDAPSLEMDAGGVHGCADQDAAFDPGAP